MVGGKGKSSEEVVVSMESWSSRLAVEKEISFPNPATNRHGPDRSFSPRSSLSTPADTQPRIA